MTKSVDVRYDSHCDGLSDLYDTATGLDFVLSLDSWYYTFELWLAARGTSLSDYDDGDSRRLTLLKTWVSNSSALGGYRFAQKPDLVFEDGDTGVLESSRMSALTSVPTSVPGQIRDMRDARKAIDKNVAGIDAFPITQSYGWLAREEKMPDYLLQTLLGAIAGVLVISLCFLEPWIALITTVSVALVNVCIFGVMAILDIRINVASIVNLVLAVGFAVDYSAHIAEGYMVKPSTLPPHLRMLEAVRDLGGSVLNGGLSTLLGVLMMAFSKSAAFTTLFRMFLAMVIFGLLHGLCFIPCAVYLLASLTATARGT